MAAAMAVPAQLRQNRRCLRSWEMEGSIARRTADLTVRYTASIIVAVSAKPRDDGLGVNRVPGLSLRHRQTSLGAASLSFRPTVCSCREYQHKGNDPDPFINLVRVSPVSNHGEIRSTEGNGTWPLNGGTLVQSA